MFKSIIVIWLILITVYLGFQEFVTFHNNDTHLSNLEKRKEIYANFNERFEKIETYINETMNPRIERIEKFLNENWGEK